MGRFEIQEKAAAGEIQDLYFSVDIETSGLVPLHNSMFSIGAVAIHGDEIISSFTRNLEVLDPFNFDYDTRLWWQNYPDAWIAHRMLPIVAPNVVFTDFGLWIDSVLQPNEIPVFLAYPATFDFSWCLAYGTKFAPELWKFAFAGFDMQSYAAALLNVPFSQARAKNWPKEWRAGTSTHTHIALDDAIEQAKQFIEMRKWGKKHLRNVISLGRGNATMLGDNVTQFLNQGDSYA